MHPAGNCASCAAPDAKQEAIRPAKVSSVGPAPPGELGDEGLTLGSSCEIAALEASDDDVESLGVGRSQHAVSSKVRAVVTSRVPTTSNPRRSISSKNRIFTSLGCVHLQPTS